MAKDSEAVYSALRKWIGQTPGAARKKRRSSEWIFSTRKLIPYGLFVRRKISFVGQTSPLSTSFDSNALVGTTVLLMISIRSPEVQFSVKRGVHIIFWCTFHIDSFKKVPITPAIQSHPQNWRSTLCKGNFWPTHWESSESRAINCIRMISHQFRVGKV